MSARPGLTVGTCFGISQAESASRAVDSSSRAASASARAAAADVLLSATEDALAAAASTAAFSAVAAAAAAAAASAAAAAAAGMPSAPAAAALRPAPAVEAYRPPGMRGRAPAFKLHETVEAGKVTGGVFGGGGGGGDGGDGAKSQTISFARPKRAIAGLTEEDTPAPGGMTKSQRKNAKKKEKAAREKAAGGAVAVEAKTNGAAASGATAPKAAAPPPPAVATVDVDGLATVAEVEKKLKGVGKKLRAVDSLAADQAAGKELNAEQVIKLGTAAALRDQVAALEARLAALRT